MLIVYLAGNKIYATYLGIPHVPGAGDLAIFCGAMIGAGLAFLWFNAHPAQVFMGDLGSLSLGAVLAVIALQSQQWLLLPIIGAIFVAEAISVMVQVSYFKWTRKRFGAGCDLQPHAALGR